MNVDIKIQLTTDVTKALENNVKKLEKQAVLVGIPHGAERPDAGMTNAQIGYIQEFGSPARKIPSRAFLVPSVTEAKDKLSKLMAPVFKGVNVQANLEKVGMAAQSEVRKYIDKQKGLVGSVPLAEATIEARKRRRKSGEAGTKTLIDTHSLVNSITYIVESNG